MGCFILALGSQAATGESAGTGSDSCAAREILLMGIIEAEGTAPNVVSEILVAESILLHQARASCESGRLRDAFILYDQLIAKLAHTKAPCAGLNFSGSITQR